MQTNKHMELNEQDEKAYDNLMVSVEASSGVLSLLFAVCDDVPLREQVIQRYETELHPQIRSYQIELSPQDPSVRLAIAHIVEINPYLQSGGKAVLTVKGAEQLSQFSVDGEPSEQDRFLGYLQWTREGFRAFPFPIILWLPHKLYTKLSQKAPDFWSWRKDVFYFGPQNQGLVIEVAVVEPETKPEPLHLKGVYEANAMPLEDLQDLIQRKEQQLDSSQGDSLLATLYEQMGRIYAGKIETAENLDYEEMIDRIPDLIKAIKSFSRAITIQESLNLNIEVASNMTWLGYLYAAKDDFKKSEEFYKRALNLRQMYSDLDDPSIKDIQNSLEQLYRSQGRVNKADNLDMESYKISKNIKGDSISVDSKIQGKSNHLNIPTVDIIGSPITALSFQDQINTMVKWAKSNLSKVVCIANVHMLIEAHQNPFFGSVLQNADLVTPDGMPLVWMLRFLGAGRQDRVAGIDVLEGVCKLSQETGVGIYFLGSQNTILEKMKRRLNREFPNLKISGMTSLPFRPLTDGEDRTLVHTLNQSGAGLIFVSLGCPKQETWMSQHKGQVSAVMVGLGGTFPVYAGIQKRAPKVIRKAGLQWLYRLIGEPRRLWKRYATTIPLFIWLVSKQLLERIFLNHSDINRSNHASQSDK
jgi:N-acetylglucosaminyldiphosphoundecaprenol N-acetyl-beta-D-mannosaminyltransferase